MMPAMSGRSKRAFSLIEVVLALGVCVFSLVAMLGLLSVGLGVGRDSRGEMQAANIAAQLVGIRRSCPTNVLSGGLLPPLNQPLSATPVSAWVDSVGNVTNQGAAAYQVSYQVGTNAAAPSTALIHLRFTWPAAADPRKAAGQYEVTTQVRMPE